jgi:hypothetical protein
MAAPPVPGLLGEDLQDKEALAYKEGHDADIPSNEGVVNPEEHNTIQKESDPEPEKLNGTSTATCLNEINADVEKAQPVPVTQETEGDPNVVDWDGPDDPANPQNWSGASKWAQIAVLSVLTLLTPLASSMFAPGVPEMMKDFHSSNDYLATFVVSVYLLGFAM